MLNRNILRALLFFYKVLSCLLKEGIHLDARGFLYAANMTNQLAEEISEDNWDSMLIPELGTLRKLFYHMVRVRDVYCESLITGIIEFPGQLVPKDSCLIEELRRSKDELACKFNHTEVERIKMGPEYLSTTELLSTAVQHEGIHQGQFFIALKQIGLKLPNQWVKEWSM